jgi:hypothetical protein
VIKGDNGLYASQEGQEKVSPTAGMYVSLTFVDAAINSIPSCRSVRLLRKATHQRGGATESTETRPQDGLLW